MHGGVIGETQGGKVVAANPRRAENHAGDGQSGSERRGRIAIGDGVAEGEPGFVFVDEAGEELERADRPVVFLLFEGFFAELPTGGQADHEFREPEFPGPLGSIHRDVAHAAGH